MRYFTRHSTIRAGGRPVVSDGGHVAGTVRRDPPWFSRLAAAIRTVVGSPAFTVLFLLGLLAWLAAGPITGFSAGWQLIATAGAPILALLLLVVIQHTQNRDDKAIQLKLDEVIRATEHASDQLIGIEDSPEVELSRLLSDYREHADDGHGRRDLAARADGGPRQHLRRRPSRPPRRERRRYAKGDVGPGQSFVFRSPEGRQSADAKNLVLFTQLAQAVDDATWLYHLRRGDYSRWFRDVINDDVLAMQARMLEGPDGASAACSRGRIIRAVGRRYPVSV